MNLLSRLVLMRPLVTIGVPVYRGENYLIRCLRSIQDQDYPDLEVLISMDGPQPDCVELCNAFLDDKRFRLILNEDRAGWAGNINRLLQQRAGEYFLFLQQDDWCEPNYVTRLVGAADAYPNAAILFSEMVVRGNAETTVLHKAVLGPPISRFLTTLERMDTSMFLGLVRSSAIDLAGLLPTSEFENFSAELAWMTRLALHGEFRSVEGTSYYKFLHSGGTHLRWYDWPRQQKREAWASLACWMLENALLSSFAIEQQWALVDAVLDRFLVPRTGDRWFFAPMDEEDPADTHDMLELIMGRLKHLPAGQCLPRLGVTPLEFRHRAKARFDVASTKAAPSEASAARM